MIRSRPDFHEIVSPRGMTFNHCLNGISNNNWNVFLFLDRLMGFRPLSVNPTRESTTQKAF